MTKKYLTGLFIAILVSLLTLPVLAAHDKARWDKAKANFKRYDVDKLRVVRIDVARELGKAMYPAVEPQAVRLLIGHITNEIKRAGSKGRREQEVSAEVLEVSVNALKKITSEKAIEILIRSIKNERLNWRVRFYLIKALGGINKPGVIETLLVLLEDKEEKLHIAALEALGGLKALEGIQAVCKILNEDRPWEIKAAATAYLAQLADHLEESKDSEAKDSVIEPLIQVLLGEKVEGRIRAEIIEILKKLTGVDCGPKGTPWLEWWKKKQKGEEVAPSGEDTETTTAYYYGIKVTSTRMVFILDISGSMNCESKWVKDKDEKDYYGNRPEPRFLGTDGKPAKQKLIDQIKAKKQEIDGRRVTKRIHAAKRELVNTIYHLAPSVHFTLIFYSSIPWIWKKTMVPATAENKLAAIEDIDKQVPLGMTATYDALEMAYKLIEQQKKIKFVQKGYIVTAKGGADTIFLVSDGQPTAGRIIDPNMIINEIKKLNQTRRIKIHTVAIGSKTMNPATWFNPGPTFMKNLAEATGGIFKDKTK